MQKMDEFLNEFGLPAHLGLRGCRGCTQHSETGMVRKCSLPVGHEGDHAHQISARPFKILSPLPDLPRYPGQEWPLSTV